MSTQEPKPSFLNTPTTPKRHQFVILVLECEELKDTMRKICKEYITGVLK